MGKDPKLDYTESPSDPLLRGLGIVTVDASVVFLDC